MWQGMSGVNQQSYVYSVDREHPWGVRMLKDTAYIDLLTGEVGIALVSTLNTWMFPPLCIINVTEYVYKPSSVYTR